MAKAKFRFGKNTVTRVVPITQYDPATGEAVKPAADAFKVLCVTDEISFGFQHGTFDLENFCTGGNTQTVRDGSKEGSVEFGDLTWVEDDPAVKILEDAAYSDTETGGDVWMEVLPLGLGLNKPVYDMGFQVNSWEMTVPAKGAITVAHNEINVFKIPERGTTAAA